MKYIINSSLQQMALAKIAAELWNQDDIWDSILNHRLSKISTKFYQKWQKVEERVEKNVSHLLLPETLKKDLRGIIMPIGKQIKSWCKYHHRKECLILRLPDRFCWTSKGTIDTRRTAETLVKDENLDLDSRYKLACIYCIENQIPELWNRIPEQQKSCYYTNESKIKVHRLVEYWTYHLTGQLFKLDDVIRRETGSSEPPHVYAFYIAVCDWNRAATKFFFKKLSDEERNAHLVTYAAIAVSKRWRTYHSKEFCTEVFIFLMSQMSDFQQLRVLLNHPSFALSCFLDFPYQRFFVDSAERVIHSIFSCQYNWLMDQIRYKVLDGSTDFDYPQLLRDFWEITPSNFKRFSHAQSMSILTTLLLAGEKDILTLVFQDANAFDKERLMFSEKGQSVCKFLVCTDKWELLQMFIELCGPSKKAMVRFKDGLSKSELRDEKGETFVRLLDDLIAKKSKIRKDDDGNHSKKLRTK